MSYQIFVIKKNDNSFSYTISSWTWIKKYLNYSVSEVHIYLCGQSVLMTLFISILYNLKLPTLFSNLKP